MKLTLRIKIWVLLLFLIAGLTWVFHSTTSRLMRRDTRRFFQARMAEALIGVSAYWNKEQNDLIRSANLFSESEKVITYSASGPYPLLQGEMKRLLANSGMSEMEIHLKSGLIISGKQESPQQDRPLDPSEPRLNLSNFRLHHRDHSIQMNAEVPINKRGEFIGLLTLMKQCDESALRTMAKILQADFSLAIRGELLASSLSPGCQKDLLLLINSPNALGEKPIQAPLAGEIYSLGLMDMGESSAREPIRMYCCLSQEKLQSMVEQGRIQILNVTLLWLTISFFLAIFFSEKVLTARIRKIRDGADLIAQENLTFRLPSNETDELGDLARGFNNMAEKIQASHHKLVVQNEELQMYLQSLENMKTYIQNILASLGTGVITWNDQGRVTTINSAAENELVDVLGDIRNLTIQRLAKRLNRKSRRVFIGVLRKLLGGPPESHKAATGPTVLMPESEPKNHGTPPFDMEFDLGPQRGFKIMQGTITYLRDFEKKAYGLIVTLENITQKRIIEQQLYHAEKLSSIGQLAASVAHEIKNPLAAIKTLGQLLQEETAAGDSRREYIDVIVSEVNRLNGVVEQLLRFARREDSKFTMVSATDLIKPVMALVNHEMERHQVKAELDIQENLLIPVDPEKIKQVFLNLIFNSIQAMTKGGTIHIKIFRDAQSPWTILQVADTGQGIPSGSIEQVFDPFFTTKQRGTGLGLAIVKKIIDLHGGRIEVNSQPASGTTFTIFLPNERKDLEQS